MDCEFVVKSIGHLLNSKDFSTSLIEQSKAINENIGPFDVSLICFVSKQPTKIEKTSIFNELLDEGKPYEMEKNRFKGYFGGFYVSISFYDEKQYDEKIKNDPFSFDSVVILYDSKIVFDKTLEMTKNHKLVNKGGKKLKRSELLDSFYRVARKIEFLERAYKEGDVLYFFSLCEQIKDGFTNLLFYMNGKPFFSFRDIKSQLSLLESIPQDYYSNMLLATQVDDIEKKIVLFKRIAYTFGLLLGIADEKKESIQVKESKSIGSDIRKVVEEKIKSVSIGAAAKSIPIVLDDSEDDLSDEDDEKVGEEE